MRDSSALPRAAPLTSLQVFLNNPFPVDIIQHSTCIRCLDMSLNRTRVAVVDTEAKLVLVDASSKVR